MRETELDSRSVTLGDPGPPPPPLPPPGFSSLDLLAGGVRLDMLVQLLPGVGESGIFLLNLKVTFFSLKTHFFNGKEVS